MIISMSECRRGGVSLAKDIFENKKRKPNQLDDRTTSFLIEKKDVFICTHRTHNINYNINFQKSTKFLN